ncbi:MAG: hypothetical protein E7178_04775 [Erysipelotrichaceae bacterium]|nr:hypothetical protein [Erysipelotrichaceae bacterium]
MGQYRAMISDLILQTRLNNKLINEVNNGINEGNLNVEELRNNHLNRVDEEYGLHDMGLPIYDFFDGTQLINSMFSTIVVPVEYLKRSSISEHRFKDKILEEADPGHYRECKERIKNLIDIRSNCYDSNHINVYGFFKHLRNALCHSGNGNIHFFPEQARDISAIYFYDEAPISEKEKEEKRYPFEKWVFLVKLDIFEELFPLIKAFDEIVLEISKNDGLLQDMESIANTVRDNTNY